MRGSIRSCVVTLVPDFQGYGFNLHAERGRAGQFVGKVDEGSPANHGGLREGDRIVEVNGVNIDKDNHKDVVDKVKAGGNSVTLLVCDQEAEQYCQKNGIVIVGSMDCVQDMSVSKSSPEPEEFKDTTETNKVHEPDNNEAVVDTNTNEADDLEDDLPPPPTEVEDSDVNLPPPPPENELELQVEEPQTNGVSEKDQSSDSDEEPSAPEAEPELQDPEPAPVSEPEPEPQAEPTPEPQPPSEPVAPQPVAAQAEVKVETAPAETPDSKVDDPLPKVSAKEMREMLKNRKKADPRQGAGQSAKDKLSMFQRL